MNEEELAEIENMIEIQQILDDIKEDDLISWEQVKEDIGIVLDDNTIDWNSWTHRN